MTKRGRPKHYQTVHKKAWTDRWGKKHKASSYRRRVPKRGKKQKKDDKMTERRANWHITFFAPNKKEAQKYLNHVKEREGYVYSPQNLRLAKKQIPESNWKTWEATIPSTKRR